MKGIFVIRVACAIILGVALGAPAMGDAVPAAIGLSVEPGGMLIQSVSPGELYDLEQKTGILLTIHNRDRSDHTYVLATFRPTEVGNRRLPPGYSDIVDPAWFWFEASEVRVLAQSSAQVRMYLKVPDDDRYYNQHWSVSVGVAGKPEPGETLTLAVYPRFEIETAAAARGELSLRPAGEVGVCPSVVDIAAGSGGISRGGFVLCNNDGRTHSFRLSVPVEGDVGGGKKVFPSGGYTWAPDSSWIALQRPAAEPYARWSARTWPTVWLARHSSLTVPIEVKVPPGASGPGGSWEAMVLIERDDGRTDYARVRLPGGQVTE